MNSLQIWAAAWLVAKEDEAAAVARRRACEDKMAFAMQLDERRDGVTTVDTDALAIKITQRIDRKVDADKVVELAAEAGIEEQLAHLFRWKPKLNMSAWKAADESITAPLAGAITAKPGRPSFSITKKG